MRSVRVGLVGDYDPAVIAHQAIPQALALAGQAVGCVVEPEWIATPAITAESVHRLAAYKGLWCVPASPYVSMSGALLAIRWARTQGVPFLGTCGGFQHTLIEYARAVLGLADAAHAETNPGASLLFVTPLMCALRGVRGPIHLVAGSRSAQLYGQATVEEEYNCGFGLNPVYREQLATGPLRITAVDGDGDARIVELAGHPFFLATLFQPERSAFSGRVHPLILGYVPALLG
ncbi:MAG: hypothetical protein M3Z04_08305 [Chloroflexota bacterium]|nr:hypothetical protein [Chloroflexota bacterium]